jgi:HSP20 family protein
MNISSGSHGLEVYETENEIVVKAPIPGIPAENLEVTFEEGVLRIRGKVEEREEDKKRKKVVHQSQRVQSFDYATTLPRPIDVSNVNAEIEHGIVTITAPLAIEAKPRKIEVKTR